MPPRPKMRVPSRPMLRTQPRRLIASRAASTARHQQNQHILPLRPLLQQPQHHQQLQQHQRRGLADKDPRPIEDRPFDNKPAEEGDGPKGPNMDQLPHVSEEAAATNKSMGGDGPQIESQGTPVNEAVKGDKEAQANLPKVMQDQIKKDKAAGNDPSGKRSFSTFARAQPRLSSASASRLASARQFRGRPFSTSSLMRQELQHHQDQDASLDALQTLQPREITATESKKLAGLKFDPPTELAGQRSHLRKRYDTVVDQVTKLLMRDGKLSVAQRNMSIILTHLRTSPAPRPSDRAPLVAGAPPHSALPQDPVTYLTVAIDSVAPLFRIRSQKGLAGGGMALQIPVPLRQRQRRRTAVMWILDQIDKRKGSTSPFAKRFGEEVVAIVEGRSAIWERRSQLHGSGTRARANLTAMAKRRR